MEDTALNTEENRRLDLLIRQARQGSTKAFNELYQRTSRWLLFQVRRIVRDGQAEDVLAEAYVQVCTKLDSYDSARSAPRVWLATIARSRALDHLRRERRCTSKDALEVDLAQAHTDSPEQLLCQLEQRQLVHICFEAASLTAKERLLLDLAYFEETSHQEIAAATGMPLGTIKSAICRARGKLRAQWNHAATRCR